MRLHRMIGYAYTAIYVVMMSEMVPRMWQYQVEFPPRTVAHLIVGITIGVILIVKISIMRFFRHLEEWMPYLGTSLFGCTVVLTMLSLPFFFREQALANSATGGDVFSASNRQRLAGLLPLAGFPPEASLDRLSSVAALRSGRDVLLNKCTRCHDIKTVLDRPRIPKDWFVTVSRMAQKPALFSPIANEEQWNVTAYLIAITPDLQKSAEERRAAEAPNPMATKPGGQDAKATFDRVCSQCHETSEVERSPPKSGADVDSLIKRMQTNGMHANSTETQLIISYLNETYVNRPRK
jgi:cytochrome c5